MRSTGRLVDEFEINDVPIESHAHIEASEFELEREGGEIGARRLTTAHDSDSPTDSLAATFPFPLARERAMTAFRVRPISPEITAIVRDTLRAPKYGHPAHRELALGTGPCRECLSTFVVGQDERLLFTYDAFAHATHRPQPGPVFIHAEPCQPFADSGYPGGLAGVPVFADVELRDGSRLPAQLLRAGQESAELEPLLARTDVRHIHLRHAEAGCFIACVERIAD
jgi:hypothetical protein